MSKFGSKFVNLLELFKFLEVPSAKEKLVALYETIIIQRPRAPIPKLLQLQYLEGAAFEEKVRTHLIACFRKGIPSLFKNMVMLYGDQQKVNKRINKIFIFRRM